MSNVRRHICIPRGPTRVRAAAQRYIGSQKTRSKCRRCSTVLEGHRCAGLSFQKWFFCIETPYSKDRLQPKGRTSGQNFFPRCETCLFSLDFVTVYVERIGRGTGDSIRRAAWGKQRQSRGRDKKTLTYFNILPIMNEYYDKD